MSSAFYWGLFIIQKSDRICPPLNLIRFLESFFLKRRRFRFNEDPAEVPEKSPQEGNQCWNKPGYNCNSNMIFCFLET